MAFSSFYGSPLYYVRLRSTLGVLIGDLKLSQIDGKQIKAVTCFFVLFENMKKSRMKNLECVWWKIMYL